MRFNNGWVKFHRSMLSSEIQGDGAAICIFTVLIAWANREDGRHKGDVLPRGALITGLSELEAATAFSRPTISRRLKLLEKCGMIARYVKRSGSLITICNYDKYQCINNEPETPSETILKRSRNDPETILKRSRTHIEELENLKREEVKNTNSCVSPPGDESEQKKKTIVPIEDPEILAVARDWFFFAQQEQPWRKEGGGFTQQAFAEAVAKVGRATELTPIGLRAVLDFIRGDEFWCKNAISPNGLLVTGKNGARKIDNILSRMKPAEDPLKRALEAWVNDPTPFDPTKITNAF